VVSNAQVGSSANKISVSFIKLLAIETLCCCHHDNSHGLFTNLSPSHTFVKSSFAFFILTSGSVQLYNAGNSTF
jgi:hypothetical protein